MSDIERIFFHMVCAECLLNGCITDKWVREQATEKGLWTYTNLLEILCKWYLDGVYEFTGRVGDGRLLFGKMRGEYRREEALSRRWNE